MNVVVCIVHIKPLSNENGASSIYKTLSFSSLKTSEWNGGQVYTAKMMYIQKVYGQARQSLMNLI